MTRPGKTKNYSVSLTAEAHRILTVRAASVHDGNLSAAVTEAAELLRREVAMAELARDLEQTLGPLTDAARARIDREWAVGVSGTTRARAAASSKRKRSAA